MLELIGKILFYGLFFIIVFFVILSFKKKQETQQELLGRNATGELKGIAILMVLVGHMTYLFGFILTPLTPALGAPAVDIFLFLSAFGLVASCKEKGMKGFVGRRIAVVLIPFILTTLIKIPFTPLEYNFKIVLSNLLGIASAAETTIDGSMWYVQYIVICYLIFWILFSIQKLEMKWKVGILCGIGAISILISGVAYYGNYEFDLILSESYSHHLSFPLGAVCCLYYDKVKKLTEKWLIGIALISFVTFQFLVYPGVDGYVKYYIHNLMYLLFFVALIGILTKRKRQSSMLKWLGGLSYYIYLNEWVVMSVVYQMPSIPNGLKAVITMVVSVIMAIPVKWMSEKIIKKITNLCSFQEVMTK